MPYNFGDYGSIGSSIGGLMQTIAAAQERQAMFNEFRRELQRQGAYGQQAMGVWQQGLGQWSPQATQAGLAAGARQRMEGYGQGAAVPASVAPSGESRIGMQRDVGATEQVGQRRAALGAYQDWMNNQLVGQRHVGQQLDLISNLAAGQAGVFPYQMYDAQHSADEMAFWGQLAAAGGKGADLGLMMFGRGGGPPKGTGYNPYTDQSTAPPAI